LCAGGVGYYRDSKKIFDADTVRTTPHTSCPAYADLRAYRNPSTMTCARDGYRRLERASAPIRHRTAEIRQETFRLRAPVLATMALLSIDAPKEEQIE